MSSVAKNGIKYYNNKKDKKRIRRKKSVVNNTYEPQINYSYYIVAIASILIGVLNYIYIA